MIYCRDSKFKLSSPLTKGKESVRVYISEETGRRRGTKNFGSLIEMIVCGGKD